MSNQYPGGYITKTPPTPSASSAPGLWTLSQQAALQKEGNWPGLGDPYFQDVTLLLTGDGTNGAQNNTFIDSSSNNFTITRNGNTTQGSFSPYGSLWSNYFNGSAQTNWISVPSNAAFNFGTGDFTIEAWVNQESTSYNRSIFQTDGSNSGGIVLAINTSNQVVVYHSGYIVTTTTTVPFGIWTHIAAVRSSGVLTVYINGVASGSATYTSSPNYASPRIASNPTTALESFGGYISNLRIVKGTAVYTSNFTPSTTPLTAISGTSLLTCQSNRFIDNSSNNFALTVNGTPSVQRFSPFQPTSAYSTSVIGGSGYFDGSGDYIYTPAQTVFNIGSNSASVELWAYSLSPAVDVSFGGQNGGSTSTIRLLQYGGYYAYTINNDTVQSTSIPLKLNQWVHLVVTITGGVARMFVNGVLGNYTTGFGSIASHSEAYVVGCEEGVANYYTGYLTDYRFVNGSIPTTYQTSSSTTGTQIFSPPTAPLTAVTNTQLLLNFTNAGIPDAAMMNDLETVGNAQISTSVKKYGTGSLYFDGSGDSVYSGVQSPGFGFGTGDFTVEFWCYPTASKKMIIVDARITPVGLPFGLLTNGSMFLGYFNGTSENYSSTGALVANTWQHVAYARSSGTLKIFKDGTQIYSASNTDNWGTALPMSIGEPHNNPVPGEAYTGYIDDLRITKGYARYTTTFTPPTAALPTY